MEGFASIMRTRIVYFPLIYLLGLQGTAASHLSSGCGRRRLKSRPSIRNCDICVMTTSAGAGALGSKLAFVLNSFLRVAKTSREVSRLWQGLASISF